MLLLAYCHAVDVADLALTGDSEHLAQDIESLQSFVLLRSWLILPSGSIGFFFKSIEFLLEFVQGFPELALFLV